MSMETKLKIIILFSIFIHYIRAEKLHRFDLGYGSSSTAGDVASTRETKAEDIVNVFTSEYSTGLHNGMLVENVGGDITGYGIFYGIDSTSNDVSKWYFTEKVALGWNSATGLIKCLRSKFVTYYDDEYSTIEAAEVNDTDGILELKDQGGACPVDIKCSRVISGRTWFACVHDETHVIAWGSASFINTTLGVSNFTADSSIVLLESLGGEMLFIKSNLGQLTILGCTEEQPSTFNGVLTLMTSNNFWTIQMISGGVSVYGIGSCTDPYISLLNTETATLKTFSASEENGILLMTNDTAYTFGSFDQSVSESYTNVGNIDAGGSSPCVYLFYNDNSMDAICAESSLDESSIVPPSTRQYMVNNVFDSEIIKCPNIDIVRDSFNKAWLFLPFSSSRSNAETLSLQTSFSERIGEGKASKAYVLSENCIFVDESGYIVSLFSTSGPTKLFEDDYIADVKSIDMVHQFGYIFTTYEKTASPTLQPTQLPTTAPTISFGNSTIGTEIESLYNLYAIVIGSGSVSFGEIILLLFSIIITFVVFFEENI